MKWIAVLFAVLQLFAWPNQALAQGSAAYRTVSTTSWVEEWDPAKRRWVRVDEGSALESARADGVPVIRETVTRGTPTIGIAIQTQNTARYRMPGAEPVIPASIARYGPFLVIDGRRAAVVGSTGTTTPSEFDRMMHDFPGLKVLEFLEAPGTSNDIANLALGRRIRAVGLATHVPTGGSVRSGAVELFLAGAQRSIAQGAQFAVHAWLDNYGREPDDFAADDPVNRLYLDYYVEMGMSEARARAFYAMTNSTPHAGAKWLKAAEMRRWLRPEVVVAPAPVTAKPLALAAPPLMLAPMSLRPSIAYGDVGALAIAGVNPTRTYAFLDS